MKPETEFAPWPPLAVGTYVLVKHTTGIRVARITGADAVRTDLWWVKFPSGYVAKLTYAEMELPEQSPKIQEMFAYLFECIRKDVQKIEKLDIANRTVEDLRAWLLRDFGVDMPNAHGLDLTTVLGAEVEKLRASYNKPAPIPMLLTCPACNQRHIDEGEFALKLHHTHACQHCGHVWRPALVHTVGVKFLPGFKNE